MDKQSSQERSVENESDASNRVLKPNLVAMKLQLLPPDVLRDILSRLSLKEVMRMSMLSCEWRQLRICHPNLVFTKDTFGIDTTHTYDGSMTIGELLKVRAKKMELLTRKFINNVDSVLRPLWSTSSTTTTTLDKFVLKFGLRRKHEYYIDRWVIFSTASRAKHIALDFKLEDESCSGSGFDKYKYGLPLSNFSGPNGSCLRSLYLSNIYLELPQSFCGITNLKKLTLNTVSINGGDLQLLLLRCAFLESLNIEMCSSLSSLRIQQELSRLQYLRVRYCDLEILELDAPNLTKFEFDDYLIQTVLTESSKLSEAIFVSNLRVLVGYDDVLDYIFTDLPAALPHVHTLLLLLTACQVCSRDKCLVSLFKFTLLIFTFRFLLTFHPDRSQTKYYFKGHALCLLQVERFSNTRDSFICLRHLNMNLGISLYHDDSWVMGFVNLLELAPLLEELEVHIDHDRYRSSDPRTVTAAQGPLHRHLRSVYISGFCDVEGLAELALYILGNATVLKRMVVDPVAGMKEDLNTEQFCSVSKGGSSEKFVLPTEGDKEYVDEKRMFAKNNLDKEEFCHILTIL